MKWNDIRIGTLGGTLCSIWVSFSLGDVMQTIITAALGTCISFVTSYVLRRILNRKR